MGFFAVLTSESMPVDQMPFVSRCHLNLWSLPGLAPGRRLMYLDVGLEVVATQSEVSAVRILLPFRLERGRWPDGSEVLQDLFGAATDQDTAELIFGGPVTMTQAAGAFRVTVGDYPTDMQVVRVRATAAKVADDDAVRQDSSLVKVTLQEAIRPGERAYFRVRFRVFGSEPLWRWSRSSGGAQVDFRICDVRESKFVDAERYLRQQILQIDQVNFFLMAPSRLVVAGKSPEFKYVRALEPGAWKKYLKGTAHLGRGGGLIVYYWQHRSTPLVEKDPLSRAAKPISADNPFRILLSLQRPQNRTWLTSVLQVAVGVLVAMVVLELGKHVDVSSWSLSDISLGATVRFLIGGTFLAFITFFERLRGWAAGRFLGPRLALRRFERWILGINAG